MSRWFLGAILCLAIAGAASAVTIPSDKIKGFSKGATTKAEVLASLGQPVKQGAAPDGGSLLRYDWTSPPTSDGKPPKDLIILFVFNPAGIYQGVQVYARNPDAAAGGGAQPASAAPREGARPLSELKDENILTPLPDGFKIGFEQMQGQMKITELIPNSETVDNWSSMITQQTFFRRHNEDPAAIPRGMSGSWPRACPGGTAQEVSKGVENGYPVSLWTFACASNPATGKPENMWMKVISGSDALYSVQYAYRSALTPQMATPTLAYLKDVKVCDTRAAAHPCPK